MYALLLTQGPRAQMDRYLYKTEIQRMLQSTPNLEIREAQVHGLQLAWHAAPRGEQLARVTGVTLRTCRDSSHTRGRRRGAM